MRSCWRWKGTGQGEYGTFTVDKQQIAAHRFAWAFAYGRVRTGACVLHACDNSWCVNPRHLRLGTMEENNLDKSVLSRIRSVLLEDDERVAREAAELAAAGHRLDAFYAEHSPRRRVPIPGGPDNLKYYTTEVEVPRKQTLTRLANGPLTEADVRGMRGLYAPGVGFRDVADRFRVAHWQAYTVITRRSWRHVP